VGNEISEGIHFDLSRERYDAIEAEHFSNLKHIGRSPLHYLHAKNHGTKDTASKKRGRAGHVATLEPDRFAAEYVVYPGERRGKKWDEFEAAHAGREILTEKEAAQAQAIAAAVRADPVAAKYLQGGRAEVSMLWRNGGTRCKGRIDYLTDAALVDLKITRDASPDGFARESWEYKSHVQASWYGDAFAQLAGEVRPFVLIAVEPEPPFLVAVYRVPPSLLEHGRRVYAGWLEQLAWSHSQEDWGGYGSAEMELQVPRFAVNEIEEAA
jgi:hypothetical protein